MFLIQYCLSMKGKIKGVLPLLSKQKSHKHAPKNPDNQTITEKHLEKYSTTQFLKMTLNMAVLTARSFWKKHRIASRLTAIFLVLVIAFALFYDVFNTKEQVDAYDLGGQVASLLDSPIPFYGALVKSDKERGTFIFNEGYTPGGGVAGDSIAPKITAKFEDKSVSVTDPVNNITVTLNANFGIREGRQDENRIVYPIKGLPATKVYTLQATGVKEDIIFRKAPNKDEVVLKYDIQAPDGVEARIESDGSIGFYGVDLSLLGDVTVTSEADQDLLDKARENGVRTQYLFSIPAPIILESLKQRSTANARFELYDNELTLRITGLKDAKYPLSVDPTIYVETARKLMRGNNESNTDFDVSNELIQKSQTTGARIDSWQTNLDISEEVWGHATAAAGGFVYRTGGLTEDGTITTPPIAESSVESLQSSNSTNFTMSMPGTRPAGDLYIAVMCHDGTGAITPPSGGGWTEYADIGEHAAYYKIGTDEGGGDEAANYTWTGASEKWGGAIIRITNFNTSTPVSPTPTTNSGNSATPTFPAITPANDNTLIIRALGADNDEINDSGWAPTSHTAISQGGPTGTQDCAYGAASMDSPPSASVSTGTTNMQSGYVNDTYGSSTIAINPAPGSGSSPTVVDTVEWAEFDSNSLAITSPNPGSGVCTDWCNETVYDLPEPRLNHTMVAYNGYLYVIGGEDSSGNRESTIYIAKIGANGEPQLWSPVDSNPDNWVYWYEDEGLSSERSYLSAVAYNNRMYIVGGQTDATPGGITTVEMADILPTGLMSDWTTTGMQALPSGAGRHMGDIVVYNDVLYTIGGFEGVETSSANMRNSTYYSKLNSDGTMNSWQATESFATARANFGGVFSYIWGAYIYMGGGCSAVNGSGRCTTFASDMQIASLNADGSLGEWRSIGNLDNTRIGYSFIGWQGGLYRIGGCVSISTSTGNCLDALADVDYGVINPAGEVSTVAISDEIGEGLCTGGTPEDCDLPALGDGAGQGGGMLSATTILNGYLYVIGGCTNFGCSTSSGNISYVAIGSGGSLQAPATCSGTYAGSWCVDSTNRVNGTSGVSAAGITTFNNRIYLVGGIDETATGTQTIYYNDVNDDGSLAGGWESVSFAGAGITTGGDETGEKAYTYAYARANPASASTAPGNLYVIGGCSGISASAGCSNSYNTSVYKCNIAPAGAVSGCTTTGQLQLDTELATETNQGLGLHSGTVYANYIYLVGGYSDNVGDRDTVYYAKFDDSNNIVDVESGTANPADDDDDWILSTNTLSVGRRRGYAFGYNGHIYAVGGYNATGTGIIPFIEWAKEDVSSGSIDSFVTSSVTINQRWGLSMAVSNSYAYVVGGCDVGASPSGCSSFEPSVQTFQLYNNDSGTPAGFTPAANQFGTDRYAASSVIHNGYIYLAGGCTDTVGNCSTTSTNVQYAALDAQGDVGTWASTTGSLPAGRGWGKLREAGGTLYYMGGQDSAGDEKSEVYYATPNASTGNIVSWATASNGLPADRTQFGAASWNDRLYVVAGINDSATPTNTVLISPDLSSGGNITSAWTTESTNTPDVARSGNTVVAYANNLYTFGGYDGSNYLLDSQFTQIESDGSIDDAWTFTTPLPNVTRQAEGFAANGYMYVVGGRSADDVCDSNTYVAPISANTTIATGNNPTGVGEWNETNVRYTGDRFGNAVSYNEGRLYLLGGGCISENSTVFDTAGADTYVVPAGVTSITVKMWGGGGGGGAGSTNGDGGAGGGAGYVESTLAVTPSETLNIYVGSAGGGGTYPGTSGGGGGGGGHSEINRSGTNLLIAAGGGGGGGGDNSSGTPGGAGGAGGGTTGVNGGSSSSAGGGFAGGASCAGSLCDGGTGGANSGSTGGSESAGDGGNGGGGSGGENNGGQADDGDGGTADTGGFGGGGGGGGGYFGGGGGSSSQAGDAGGGGGGGGSNYLTGTSQTNGQGSGQNPANSGDSARAGAGVGGGGGGTGATGSDGADGIIVITYGTPTMTLTGSDRIVRTTLLSQPQIAIYSRLIDTDTNVFPNSWLLNGLDNSIGARWQATYQSAVDAPSIIADENFTGTNNATMTSSNTSWDTCFEQNNGGTPTARFDTDYSISSPSSGEFRINGGTGYTGCYDTHEDTATRYNRFYFRPSSFGGLSANVGFFSVFDTTPTYNTMASLQFSSTGQILIRDRFTTDVTWSAPTANTWHRIEVGISNDQMTVRLFRDGNLHGDTPDDSTTINLDDVSAPDVFNETRIGINSNPNGDTWALNIDDFKSSSTGWVGSARPGWGQITNYGDVTLGDVAPYIPLDASGVDTEFARWFFFSIKIDASQTFGYPEDVNRGPTIADLSLFFTSDPSKRLRHGKTFTGGEQQPLDTPCRQSNDADCPQP